MTKNHINLTRPRRAALRRELRKVPFNFEDGPELFVCGTCGLQTGADELAGHDGRSWENPLCERCLSGMFREETEGALTW